MFHEHLKRMCILLFWCAVSLSRHIASQWFIVLFKSSLFLLIFCILQFIFNFNKCIFKSIHLLFPCVNNSPFPLGKVSILDTSNWRFCDRMWNPQMPSPKDSLKFHFSRIIWGWWYKGRPPAPLSCFKQSHTLEYIEADCHCFCCFGKWTHSFI